MRASIFLPAMEVTDQGASGSGMYMSQTEVSFSVDSSCGVCLRSLWKKKAGRNLAMLRLQRAAPRLRALRHMKRYTYDVCFCRNQVLVRQNETVKTVTVNRKEEVTRVRDENDAFGRAMTIYRRKHTLRDTRPLPLEGEDSKAEEWRRLRKAAKSAAGARDRRASDVAA